MSVEPQQPVTRSTVDWAPVPRVNLLPPEILTNRHFRRTQRLLAAAVLTVLVAGVGAVGLAQLGVAGAAGDLAATKARHRALEAQVVQYAEVPRTLAELDSARAIRERALGTDVLWFRFLTDLALNTPANADLTSIDIIMRTRTTSTAPSVPLSPSGYGEVKVNGSAAKFTEVAAWLESVSEVHGLTGSLLQSATRGEAGPGTTQNPITYTGTAVVTADALSHRYDRKAG
jgi:hypothetical protein